MIKEAMGMIKGIFVGLLLCLAVVEGWKMCHMMEDPKNRRKKCRIKRDANRAVHAIGDMVEDVTCMMKSK